MEQMLEVAEKMQEDQGTLEELHKRTSSMERERERAEPSRNVDAALDEAAEQIASLEAELDDAQREIGRLNAILAQSPARKAIDHARESRIEMLEREKEELLERIRVLKSVRAQFLERLLPLLHQAPDVDLLRFVQPRTVFLQNELDL